MGSRARGGLASGEGTSAKALFGRCGLRWPETFLTVDDEGEASIAASFLFSYSLTSLVKEDIEGEMRASELFASRRTHNDFDV